MPKQSLASKSTSRRMNLHNNHAGTADDDDENDKHEAHEPVNVVELVVPKRSENEVPKHDKE
jgi:hypothetical protein